MCTTLYLVNQPAFAHFRFSVHFSYRWFANQSRSFKNPRWSFSKQARVRVRVLWPRTIWHSRKWVWQQPWKLWSDSSPQHPGQGVYWQETDGREWSIPLYIWDAVDKTIQLGSGVFMHRCNRSGLRGGKSVRAYKYHTAVCTYIRTVYHAPCTAFDELTEPSRPERYVYTFQSKKLFKYCSGDIVFMI